MKIPRREPGTRRSKLIITMEKADYRQLNGIALAYLGDAVYEVFIRQHLLSTGLSKPTKLQHIATHYVSAKAQAALIDLMKEDNL